MTKFCNFEIKVYDMDIQTRKIEFVRRFLILEDEKLVSQFEKLLKENQIEEADEQFKPMSVSELNKRIDKSEKDFKDNRYKSTSELLAKYQL